MGDVEEAWAADMLYGSEPSAAPSTETLVAEEAELPSGAVEVGGSASSSQTVGLDTERQPDESAPPDVNAGAKKTAIVLGAALLCAVAVIATALVTFSDTAPAPSPRPTASAGVSAAPMPTTALPQADQDRAIAYTASANCPGGVHLSTGTHRRHQRLGLGVRARRPGRHRRRSGAAYRLRRQPCAVRGVNHAGVGRENIWWKR